ncbi:MAG: porin family protein [Paludibacteraceae bacterium]|nr:porin family protein [Paludibacteraceae bacterium]
MNRLKQYILVLLFGLLSHTLSAQYLGEFGAMGGVSYYNGDANSTNIFYENHPYFGGLLRLNLSKHWLVKFDLGYGTVSGDIANFPSNKFPFDEASFEHDFWNAGCMFELNFFRYGISRWDKEVRRHTPYVTAGPSLGIYQGWNGHKLAGGLAFGVGYKFKVAKRLNVGVEWNMHKLFRDDFDGDDFGTKLLDDPYNMGYSAMKNNDWYSCGVAFITVDIFKRRGVCRLYD